MKCPETAQLIDFLRPDAPPNPEVHIHIESCESCRGDLRLLRDLEAAMLAKDVVVPPELNDRALERIRAEARKEAMGAAWGSGKRWAVASALGALTGGSAMLVVGTLGQASPVTSALLIVGAGVLTGFAEVYVAEPVDGGDPRSGLHA